MKNCRYLYLAILLLSSIMFISQESYAAIYSADTDGDGINETITTTLSNISVYHPRTGQTNYYGNYSSAVYSIYKIIDTDGQPGAEIIVVWSGGNGVGIDIIHDSNPLTPINTFYFQNMQFAIYGTADTDGQLGDEIIVNYCSGCSGHFPPYAADDCAETNLGTPVTINVLANDRAIMSQSTLDPSTVTVTSIPLDGSAVKQADGTIVYTPSAGFADVDYFKYTVKDNAGAVSNEATVSVHVGASAGSCVYSATQTQSTETNNTNALQNINGAPTSTFAISGIRVINDRNKTFRDYGYNGVAYSINKITDTDNMLGDEIIVLWQGNSQNAIDVIHDKTGTTNRYFPSIPYYIDSVRDYDSMVGSEICYGYLVGSNVLYGLITDRTQQKQENLSSCSSLHYFTISASSGVGGSISPFGNRSVAEGTDQAFNITPNSCYDIADVHVDGSSVGPVATYTFNNVSANHTIASSFAIKTYTITASAGSGGTIAPSGNVSVNCGGSKTFTITPDSCYIIADVKVDGNSLGPITSYTFTNVMANHTITASFAIKTYTITSSAGSGGTITPSGNVSSNCGGSQCFTISPLNDCYHIVDVRVDGNSVGAVTGYCFNNVTSTHTISATFSNTYLLNTTKSDASTGLGTIISSPAGINCGINSTNCGASFPQDCSAAPSSVTLTATPDSNSSFTGWSGACSGTSECTIIMNSDKQAIATFSISPPIAGFIATPTTGYLPFLVSFSNQSMRPWLIWPDTYTWDFGDGQTSNEQNPQHIYRMAGTYAVTLTVRNPSGTDISAPVYITVDTCSNLPVRVIHQDNTVSGYYSNLQDAYNATIDRDSIQALSINLIGDLNADEPKIVTLEGGYGCDYQPIGSVTSLLGSITVNDGTLTAGDLILVTGLSDNIYTIAASSGLGGSISPAGTLTVAQGGGQTFTMSAAPGYQILDVLVDGQSQGPVATYTFSNVMTNHTIKAVFALTLTVIKSGVGLGTVTSTPAGINCGSSCSAEYLPSTAITLTATPNPYSTFTGWSGGGCSGTGTCTVTLNDNTTVTATFMTGHAVISGISYDTLQAAYNAAPDGATILVRNLTFAESLNANRSITVTIAGGYDAGFASQTGVTTLQGTITVGSGTLTVGNLILAQ